MEIFVSEKEMPKDCCSCVSYYMNPADTYSCSKIGGGSIYPNFTNGQVKHNRCPYKSLEQHDRELLKDFYNNLWDWIEQKYENYSLSETKGFAGIDVLKLKREIKILLKERGVDDE